MSLLAAANCANADEFVVQLRLTAPLLSEDEAVYVTGSGMQLANWRPDVHRMQHAGGHAWSFDLKLPSRQMLEYKYTLGSWSREGADNQGKPLPNFRREVAGAVVIEDRIERWTKPRPRETSGQITGSVRYHRKVSHPELRDRDVVVWLPPDYAESSDRYPVLYMQDGQNLFDPTTSAFGVDWQIDEACTRLIQQQAIAPLIVVGIYNTPERSREYLLGEQAGTYRQFVIDVIKPLVDQEYRTKPDRQHTLAGGSSAGGLCAFVLAWEHADVFSKAICMSPAFRFESADAALSVDYVATVAAAARPNHELSFYVDNGGTGVDEQLQPGVEAMIEVLRSKGFREGEDLRYFHDPDAPHNEAAWAKRFPAAIARLLQPTDVSAETKEIQAQPASATCLNE
ncbi:MAG: alpha/beta hydrolase-fold protein [Planctomycetota bacterium]